MVFLPGLQTQLGLECLPTLGADAVVGVDLDYETLGAQNGMLMVTASGTAVKLG